jgi:hypothetical protein
MIGREAPKDICLLHGLQLLLFVYKSTSRNVLDIINGRSRQKLLQSAIECNTPGGFDSFIAKMDSLEDGQEDRKGQRIGSPGGAFALEEGSGESEDEVRR